MATITPGAVYPVASPFNTNPAYGGTFIPALWSGKLNAKYYVDNQLTEIVNTNWEGEIKNQGDTVRILTAPTLTISDYTVGTGIAQYQVPTPVYQDFVIDKGKMFHFQVNDVLEAQSDASLMNMFMEDAAKQLKIAIADEVYFNTFLGTAKGATGTPATYGADAKNWGATAGVKSSALNLGTPDAPIDVTGTAQNLLALILRMGAALDEQNVPESGRWLLLSPFDRQILMQSNLAQAYFTGDSQSIVRTGKIGMIDRFSVYVSNMLPRRAADKAWVSGQTDPSTGAAWDTTDNTAQRMVVAGTKDAITHASQVVKTEQLRNQSDFGDLVRGLNVYGRKVVKPEALTIGIVK